MSSSNTIRIIKVVTNLQFNRLVLQPIKLDVTTELRTVAFKLLSKLLSLVYFDYLLIKASLVKPRRMKSKTYLTYLS